MEGQDADMTTPKSSVDLRKYLCERGVAARLIEKTPTQSTTDACAALNAGGIQADLGQFIKAIILIGAGSREPRTSAMAMVRGTDRLDLNRVREVVQEKMKIPSPAEAAAICAYPRGGTPPVGAEGISTIIVDRQLVEPPRLLYGGGGDQQHVTEIASVELLRHLQGVSATVIVTQIAVETPQSETRP
jgi:prolyl-tRNA editing enzyme YbaK/EbsC (Cys-tRNA(Pro) deacylase)